MFNIYIIGLGLRQIKKALQFDCPVTGETLVEVTFSSGKSNDMSLVDFEAGAEATQEYLDSKSQGTIVDLSSYGLS